MIENIDLAQKQTNQVIYGMAGKKYIFILI